MTNTMQVTLEEGPAVTFGGSGGKKTSPDVMAKALRSLSMLLRYGSNESEALENVGYMFEKYSVGQAMQDASDLVFDEGATFAQAMLAQEVFPRTVRELILAAPSQDLMWKALDQAATIVQQSQNVKKKLLMNLISPGFMLAMCIGFLFASATWIIPGILNSFSTLGSEPPEVALIVLTVANYAKWVLGALIVVVLLVVLYWSFIGRNKPEVRELVDHMVNRIPIVGNIVSLSSASRLFMILAANLSTGRSEPNALESSAAGCGNEALFQHCVRHAQLMRSGDAKLREFAETPFVPMTAQFMLATAPSIRQEIDILEALAPEYLKEAEMQLETFSRTIEPLMNYIVYAVAALLIIAVVVPMYSMFPAIMELTN